MDQVIALHRFGTKYQCDTMTQAVVGRLHSEFPCKLDDFLAIYTSHLTHKGEEACKCGTLACAPEFLIKIINYAMDNDLRAILAVACFLASDLSILVRNNFPLPFSKPFLNQRYTYIYSRPSYQESPLSEVLS